MTETPKDRTGFADMVATSEAQIAARPGLDILKAWQGLELPAIRADMLRRLGQAGIAEAQSDARVMLAHVFAPHSFADAVADPALCSWQTLCELAEALDARLQRKPVSHILGSQPFWTLDLKVTGDVLTPRPDTESLVEAVLTRDADHARRVLDLGTGSGAILLALLAERPDWQGTGVDKSPHALAIARENARRCGLDGRIGFVESDWGADLVQGGFDIIVSNPPYITSAVLAGLEPEVRDHEPHLALDGGEDGLTAYRQILAQTDTLLRPGGLLAVEIGYDQGAAVSGLMAASGLSAIEVLNDLAGQQRVVLGYRPDNNG